MASTIKLKNGSGAPTSGQLVQGEPAFDLTNKRLYTENASGTVIEVGTNPSSLTTASADINGGTIDGTVIGGSSAAAGTFTSITGTSANINGTVTADGLTVESASSTVATFSQNDGTNNPRLIISDDANGMVIQNGFSSGTQRDLTFKRPFGQATMSIDGDTGDISFYEDTGTTAKFFWDASAESLGIGTTTPTGRLTLQGAAGTSGKDQGLSLRYSTGTEFGALGLNNSTGWPQLMAREGAGLTFHVNSDLLTTGEAMRIDSAGKVGIGTSSPVANLQVSDISNTDVSIVSSTSALRLVSTGGNNYIQSGTSLAGNNTALIFTGTNGVNERMRIDSSGNLLVGTTSATGRTDASSGEGIALSAGSYGGFIGATRASGNPLALNRLTTDGALATFAKDGTTVGSIGAFGGDLTLGTGITGIHFKDASDAIIPYNVSTGADRNGDIDLGLANNRFKDLYLSGGVYLGGTGAANKLDDYEEGTFTPVFGASTTDPSVTYGAINSGSYVKVGSLVMLNITLQFTAQSGGSGAAVIRGLPFSVGAERACGSVGYVSGVSFANQITVDTAIGYTILFFRDISKNGGGSSAIDIAAFNSSGEYQVSIAYYTNA